MAFNPNLHKAAGLSSLLRCVCQRDGTAAVVPLASDCRIWIGHLLGPRPYDAFKQAAGQPLHLAVLRLMRYVRGCLRLLVEATPYRFGNEQKLSTQLELVP